MDALITFVAKYFILIPILVNIYIFIKLNKEKRQEMLVLLFFMGIISIVLAKIGSHLFYNPRPYISDNTPALFNHSGDPNGFPSDHTLFSAFLAFGALAYSKKSGIFLLAIAVLIGWARVAAHVHHAADIVGSLLITGTAFIIVINGLKNKKVSEVLKNHTDKK
jgi:undecaprenyl-diphosphatase